MNSTGILLLLLGLILVIPLGWRRDPVLPDPEGISGPAGRVPEAMASASGTPGRGSRREGSPFFVGRGPQGVGAGGMGVDPGDPWSPAGTPGSLDASSHESSLDGPGPFLDGGVDPGSPGLPSLEEGLAAAATPEQRGSWADRMASLGGAVAVDALVQASLERRSPADTAALLEAFKGFSTEEDMEALAIALSRIDDVDLIETIVETLARGARPATVDGLIRGHAEAAGRPAARAALAWAIERIRNPEAVQGLLRLVETSPGSELAEAGLIALSALRSLEAAESPPTPTEPPP